MLTADYIASLSDGLAAMYGEVESDIMNTIVERIEKTHALSETSIFQIEKLRDLGVLSKDINRILAKALKISDREVKTLMQKAGVKSLNFDDAIYSSAGLTPEPIAKSTALQEVIKAGVVKTNGMMKNFTSTAATTARGAYSSLLDKAYVEVSTDAYSIDEALRRAVTRLAEDGITKVAYPPRNGSQRHETIEASVRKCVTTGVNQTVAQLQLTRMEEMGVDLVEVTSHAGARPSHALWQGKIYRYNK